MNWAIASRSNDLLTESSTAFPNPSFTPTDSDAIAWIAAVGTAGGTVSSARQQTVETLILGLKTDGIWSKLDRLWLFAVENTQSALIDLVARTQATAVNSPTFTADRGYACGSPKYINTNFNGSTQGVNYTASSKHIAIWDNTSRGALTNVGTGAWTSNSAENSLFLYQAVFANTGLGFRIGDSFQNASVANSASQGFFLAQAITNVSWPGYYNGALLGTYTSGFASSLVNTAFFVGGRSDNGTLSNPTNDQFSMVSYGGKLTNTEVTNYYNRLRTYMTACGVP